MFRPELCYRIANSVVQRSARLIVFSTFATTSGQIDYSGVPGRSLITPWRDLVEKGIVDQDNVDPVDILTNLPNPDDAHPKYGTERKLTLRQVRRLVMMCKSYQKKGGSVHSFYDDQFSMDPPCSYETFRAWMKNPEFAPP